MVFGVGQFKCASHIWLGHSLVATATKICDFQHKICTYYGVFGVDQFNGVSQTLLRRPLLPW